MMETWKRLDLRQRSLFGPFDDQLVAIRFVPKDSRGIENYDGCERLADARKKYDIWWTPLPKAVPAEVLRRRA